MPAEGTLGNFRLGEGGLLRRFETATHLTRLPRQIVTLIAVSWLPVVLLAGWNEWQRGVREPLLHDASMHVRMLVAAPVFLFLDRTFPPVCRLVLEQLVTQGFVPATVQPRLDRILASGARLTDSSLPELILALLGVALAIGTLLGVVPATGIDPKRGLTPAQVWYALADWPLFQFLLWRSLWRWMVWVRILYGISRLDLALVPTHPDRRAGISFLRLPSVGYCATLLFAIASVLCAELGGLFAAGTTLASFKPLFLLFAAVGALVAFGPLLFFAPRLFRVRRQGLIDCCARAADEGRCFRSRGGASRMSDPRANADITALAEVAQVYRDTVDRLSIILVDKRDIIVLLVATAVPLVPVMLWHVPAEDWHDLLALLTGGRLH